MKETQRTNPEKTALVLLFLLLGENANLELGFILVRFMWHIEGLIITQ
jgi:hypothetical protein